MQGSSVTSYYFRKYCFTVLDPHFPECVILGSVARGGAAELLIIPVVGVPGLGIFPL